MPAPPPQRAGSLQAAVAVGAETTFLKTINWCGCKKKSIDCKFKTIKNTHLIVNVKRENFNISISDLFNVKVCNCQCFGLKLRIIMFIYHLQDLQNCNQSYGSHLYLQINQSKPFLRSFFKTCFGGKKAQVL